nr:reverse transcriptase domain-containing protein [Tanacetum cinerariifolium]
MLERLAGNEYYCFLDGFLGYFKILIDPQDQENTTFTCPYGTFAYRRMPFGLCNEPGTFQRCVMAIFHDMIEKTMEVFMDDFLVFRNSFETCLSYLDKMLKWCEDTKLCLNWEKSHFMVKEGIVLGHKILKNGIEVEKVKVDVIAKLPHPTTVKGIRSFLGHAGMSSQQKNKFFKDVKHYFWDDPSCLKSVRIKSSGGVFTARKPVIFLRLSTMDPPGTSWPKLHRQKGIDFMSLFPSSRGNKYILVAIDYLSEWVEAKALPTNDARVVCKFLKSLFAWFGTPRAIISDRVIEFSDSYKAPPEETCKGPASESSARKKGRNVAITTKDMQKRRNDVKARTTLLLALPDEHQLRFSKYKTAKDLWEAILKTFGGNEATKKTMKNQLKLQYGNFKAEGSETVEQTFNRLQTIVSHLEFIDVEIQQDDLNQKFLTSLAPEWLMYSIVWRNKDDLDTMSLDDVYNHLKVYELEVQKKSESNSQNMAFISSSNTSSEKGEVHTASVPTASTQVSTASTDVVAASLSHDTICAYIATQSNGSHIKYEDITQIDEYDIEEMDIKWNITLLSIRADRFWKKTGKKITIQGSDVASFEKSKVECFNCHKMGHFARECRAPRSQDRGKKESYKQGSKVEEPSPKALMAVDGIGWDWSYMANEEENHALVKKEKESLDNKLTGFENASKDLDNLLGSQRSDKNKEGLGYSAVPPPPAQIYSPPKKYLSWTGLPEFVDDTVTDYRRPTPSLDASKYNKSESKVAIFLFLSMENQQ